MKPRLNVPGVLSEMSGPEGWLKCLDQHISEVERSRRDAMTILVTTAMRSWGRAEGIESVTPGNVNDEIVAGHRDGSHERIIWFVLWAR